MGEFGVKIMKITDTHVYFFSYKDFPSNFHLSSFVDNGIPFNCVEQYFMFQKALVFQDVEIAEKILLEKEPIQIKKLGRKIKNFNEFTWAAIRSDIMRRGLSLKFKQNERLKQKFLEHKGKTFVEASPYDKIWGVGLRETDPLILDKSNWRGSNLLGQLLTELVKELN